MKLLILLLLFSVQSIAQINMQDWRIHFSAYEAIDVIKLNDNIVMAAQNGIINYNLTSKEINTITVTTGLTDKGISAIAGKDNKLLIGYSNGNFDIIIDNEIINIPWLKRALISGSKSINNILVEGDDIAYLATGAGLLVFDLNKLEFKNTYSPKLGTEVLDVAIFNDTFYLGTNEGLFYGDKNNQFLNNSENWNKKNNLPNTINTGKITELEVFNDQLFMILDNIIFNGDSLFVLTKSNEISSFFSTPVTLKRLSADENFLTISRYANTMVYDKNLTQTTKNIYDYSFGPPPKPNGAIYYNNEVWIADQNNGLVRAVDAFSNNRQVYANSPFLDGCFRLDIKKGKVAVAGGGLTANLKNVFALRGIYLFEDEAWKNINHRTNPVELNDSLNWDFIAVSINPTNSKEVAFASNSKGGLKIINDGVFIHQFDYQNSPIETQLNNSPNQIISDLQYDKEGNLWVVNSGIDPLKMFDKDGKWHEFNLGNNAQNRFHYRLLIDSKGYKWIAVHDVGVVVYDDNGTYDDLSDDRYATITTSPGFGDLASNEVRSITEDIDGEVWIGTTDGIGVIYNVENVFGDTYGDADVSKIVIFDDEKDEYVPIFDKVTINAMVIDGGNRKWIGTNASGVFCMSPNGKEEIYHFDASNSPLISNTIVDIKIDYESGEIFFVTDEGLISYRGDVTAGDNNFSDVKVYPNPVRPEHVGVITIEGVGYESQVRITDISGNIVYETVSNGGTILWDGNRLNGDRVQTGVYLVWSALKEGKGKNVAKILIVN